jgi:hypothetical protein
MMTKFKSVSAQTPKLVGKNLAKVKGGNDAWPANCLTENNSARNLTTPFHGCLIENISARNLTGPFHGCLIENASARNLGGPFHGCLTEEAQ